MGNGVSVGSYGRCWHPQHVEVGWRPTAKAIGNGLIAAGIGSAMSHGPGQLTTTARGWMTRAMVGAGYPAPNGRHPG